MKRKTTKKQAIRKLIQVFRMTNVLKHIALTCFFAVVCMGISRANHFYEANAFLSDPPEIVTHPQSQSVTEGDSVALFVSVTRTEPLTYYWYKDGNYLSGESDSVIIIDPVQLADSGSYYCTVSSPFGFATSNTALLTVLEGIHFAPQQQKVFASAGGLYQTSSHTLSTTIGESVIGTYINTSNKLTTGFQQPRGKPVAVDITIFLEGPFSGLYMSPLLSIFGYTPTAQPYDMDPWYYDGTEAIESPVPSAVVDGKVVGNDGISPLYFSLNRIDNLYAVVWHRNHIGIMSAYPLTEQTGIYSYDFSISADQAYRSVLGHKEIGTGIWGMVAADGNADGQISNEDKNDVWAIQAGQSGYLSGDFSMEGQVNQIDKNDKWAPNVGKGGQVPDLIQIGGYQCQVPQ